MNAKDALSIFIVEQNAVPAFDFADQAFLLEPAVSCCRDRRSNCATMRRFGEAI